MTYGEWTDEEKIKYQDKRIKDLLLRQVYLNAQIPVDKPEQRAKYLAESILKLTLTDHDTIMSGKESKPEKLIALEELFCKVY